MSQTLGRRILAVPLVRRICGFLDHLGVTMSQNTISVTCVGVDKKWTGNALCIRNDIVQARQV